ncbi:hypothetical protein, unlikely [Trypanosoma brucei gambiense DAL972]|uniref:Uncharacterized protein n=1 Tax=Trypanosoma brucei gambiense (strain MHOM/CI/86/DAL972) TaxID=679716 RepID=C9ZXC8_TRYB9|nr:hypothetical protein, unlikely [Trypanosoma brucei gambiense DAL972]CBH14072.1 hypothetical protein, unlikely [Trypanosoma brucei gambiense DAL972]|eukprot:XP_011776343.1 hypothetical protein, unlikely [Trypanosoma brucei gambiense DAL972]
MHGGERVGSKQESTEGEERIRLKLRQTLLGKVQNNASRTVSALEQQRHAITSFIFCAVQHSHSHTPQEPKWKQSYPLGANSAFSVYEEVDITIVKATISARFPLNLLSVHPNKRAPCHYIPLHESAEKRYTQFAGSSRSRPTHASPEPPEGIMRHEVKLTDLGLPRVVP